MVKCGSWAQHHELVISTNAVSKRMGELCIFNFISTTKPGRKVEKQRVNQEQHSLEQLFWHLILQTLEPNMVFINQISKIWHSNSS